MSGGMFATPRPVPSRVASTIAGGTVIALALPVFAVAGWPLEAWGLAAVLWAGSQVFAFVLARIAGDADTLAAAGMRGIGTTSRGLLVGIPLIAVTVADERLGIAAAILYALAYTVELAVGLVTYFAAASTREARA
jgi:peptidoglycan/LPS O-acetylase OafA/YrhL